MIIYKFKKVSLLILGLLICLYASTQVNIEGYVKTADTKEYVPYATVKNVNSKKYCVCNENGYFKIVIDSFPEILQINFIGYKTEQVVVNKTDTILNIMLKPANLNLGEVNVYANKSNLEASSLETLKSIESYNLAGTSKDVFRSIQMLPGVSSNNALSAQYNVRGGTFEENLMLINGVEVAEPYHIKILPMVSIGIFNMDMVNRIDFSGGGFSAEYGNALSSVLNVSYRKANSDSIKGMVSLGLVDLGFVIEIPATKKLTWLFGARRSYLDPIINMIDPVEAISLRYYDIQSKLDYAFNSRNKISVLAIYSKDKDKVGPLTREVKKITTITDIQKYQYLQDANYSDILLALTSKHVLSGRLIVNSEFSFYQEDEINSISQRDSGNYIDFEKRFVEWNYYMDDIKDYKLINYEGKISGKIMINGNNNSKIGIYIKGSNIDYIRNLTNVWQSYNNMDRFPDTVDIEKKPTDSEYNSIQLFNAKSYKMGAYLTHAWQISPKLTINLGVRGDYFELNKELNVSPRTSLAYELLPNIKVSAAWGVFYQSPTMKQLKYSYASTENTKSQKATHYMLGIERKSNNITVKIEAYYKEYDSMLPIERTSLGEIIYPVKDNIANGYANGINAELIITKKYFDFWLNYNLGNAKERLNGTTQYYSRFTDQRHSVSSLFLFKMKHRNQFSTKVAYGSGYAYRKLFYDELNNSWTTNGETTSEYLPYYLSIDLRYQKEYRLKHSNNLKFYLDLNNMLNRKNKVGHLYGTDLDGPFEEYTNYIGILPTLGVILDF